MLQRHLVALAVKVRLRAATLRRLRSSSRRAALRELARDVREALEERANDSPSGSLHPLHHDHGLAEAAGAEALGAGDPDAGRGVPSNSTAPRRGGRRRVSVVSRR